MSLDDFNRLTVPELKAGIKAMSDAMRKSGKRLEAMGYSHFRQKMQQAPLSRAGSDINRLRREFARGKGLVESPTSTVTGVRNIIGKTKDSLQKQGVEVSEENVGNLFQTFDKLKERNQGAVDPKVEYRIKAAISEMLDAGDMEQDEILETAMEMLDAAYEEMTADTDFYTVENSDIFQFGEGM